MCKLHALYAREARNFYEERAEFEGSKKRVGKQEEKAAMASRDEARVAMAAREDAHQV